MEIRKKLVLTTLMAIMLHFVCLYISSFLQNAAYQAFKIPVFMIIKFILRMGYLLVPFVFMKLGKETLKDIGFTRNKICLQIIIGILLGILQSFLIIFPTILLGMTEQLGEPIYTGVWQYIFYLLYTLLAVGLFEEVFFRGFIFKRLLDFHSSKVFAIIVSSLIFGLCHFFGHAGFFSALPQVGISFVTGIVYCILREKIKYCTILSLIFMHGIYDFLIIFTVYVLK